MSLTSATFDLQRGSADHDRSTASVDGPVRYSDGHALDLQSACSRTMITMTITDAHQGAL
jgi:hypothetical protein